MAAVLDNRRSSLESGFSLIELMVAMALSLVLLAGVLAIFASSRTTYETTDRLSRIQEGGRFALDVLVRDLRTAGYNGCSRSAEFTNALNTPSVFWNLERPVQGFDAQSGSWTPTLVNTDTGDAPGALAGSDALVIRGIPRTDFEPVRVAAGMQVETDTFEVVPAGAALLEAGDVVMISDCQGRAAFEITANAAGVIEHAVGGGEEEAEEEADDGGPGNATDNLGFAFDEFAEVVPIQSSLYYIANNPNDNPSLYRRVSGGAPEELVEGVEAMQVLFGERIAPNVFYRTADAVTNWENVVAVRIALLVRSMSEYGVDEDNATYDLLGVDYDPPADRHMRQVFTTTVSLRNLTR
jgi:type IV pilus assembly protein PilW